MLSISTSSNSLVLDEYCYPRSIGATRLEPVPYRSAAAGQSGRFSGGLLRRRSHFEVFGQGIAISETKLLAAHKAAWRVVGVRPGDPLGAILATADMIERVRLAVVFFGHVTHASPRIYYMRDRISVTYRICWGIYPDPSD